MTTVFFSNPQRLFIDSLAMLKNIPSFDAVIGIPRSGNIVASFFASALNAKVGFINRETGLIFFDGGHRVLFKDNIKSVLLVEDSSIYGNFIRKTKPFLKDYIVKTACVYVDKSTIPLVDYFGVIADLPRIYSWNLLNHDLLSSSCVDLDGVLCFDPTDEENDDGEKYVNFILTAKPKFRCMYEINSIVTSRLEKYRKETEIWLSNNNIRYRNLIMSPHKSKEERLKCGDHAIRKAEYYSKSECFLFIESSDKQAREISSTGKSVICTDTMIGYNTR